MISRKLMPHLERLLKTLEGEGVQAVLEALTSFEEAHDSVNAMFPDFLGTSDNATIMRTHNESGESIERLNETLRDISPVEIIVGLNSSKEAVALFLSEAPEISAGLDGFGRLIEKFLASYEAYLKTYSAADTITMLYLALALRYQLLGTVSLLGSVRSSLRNEDALGAARAKEFDEESRFSLLLDSDLDLTAFALKLQSLIRLYEELALLLNVSTKEHSIKIIKVESGSLWADVLGYPKIIDLMVRLTESTANWMYRKYTEEGKICTIPKKVEAVDSILELSRNLAAAGLDTSELDETVKKSAIVLSQQLNTLLAGEPRVEVNLKPLSVGKELEDKLLEDRKRLLLGTGQRALDGQRAKKLRARRVAATKKKANQGGGADG